MPVEEVVKGSSADVEVVLVEIIELVGVEPIGCPEEREEKDDVGIRFQSNEKAFEF